MNDFKPLRFGKYLLLDKIATGGMAQLYLAKMIGIQGFEKLIAIKMILPHLVGEKELVTSFVDEAKLAALLQHQNIVQIYDFGTTEDSYFISMEYLFGKDLKSIWKKAGEKGKPVSLENALYIISRVCSGLSYAHELRDFQGKALNIIHRDINPQNIFITYQGDVKILDFGIAKAASQSTVTQHGMIKGKVAYMSPEQAEGTSIDQRSDLFSAGVILYELTTGTRMFTGESTLQILAKVREGSYEAYKKGADGLSPEICTMLKHTLEKEPSRRYQTAAEMHADLEECMIELHMRPDARGLSRYMNELFEDEIIGESRRIRELCGADKVDEIFHEPQKNLEPELIVVKSPSKRKPPHGKQKDFPDNIQTSEKIEIPSIKARQSSVKLALRYIATGVIVIGLGVGLGLWVRSMDLQKPGQSQKTTLTATAAPVSSIPQNPASTPLTHPLPPVAGADVVTPSSSAQAPPGKDSEKSKELEKQAAVLIKQDPSKARSLLIESVKLDPANMDAQSRLALLHITMKDYTRAIEAYKKVVQVHPALPDARFNLGYAYAMNKEYARAEEMYSEVVRLSPAYMDEAYYNLAMVQEKQGKKDEAMANLINAQKTNPKSMIIKNALEKFKQNMEKDA